ncbi:hypothetical protein WG922_07060 [Ramlibacter sp. AN1015]|uniref:hypothetical protein n=1 Tax=Ramlibacter sp. AN1015 TaxID=3133428 RepID=UPI0030BE2309
MRRRFMRALSELEYLLAAVEEAAVDTDVTVVDRTDAAYQGATRLHRHKRHSG